MRGIVVDHCLRGSGGVSTELAVVVVVVVPPAAGGTSFAAKTASFVWLPFELPKKNPTTPPNPVPITVPATMLWTSVLPLRNTATTVPATIASTMTARTNCCDARESFGRLGGTGTGAGSVMSSSTASR